MIRWIIAAAVMVWLPAAAWADIIEVRGKGMMTGKITSQNGEDVTFTGNGGNEMHFKKSDILFYDVDGGTPKADKGEKVKTDYVGKIKNFFSDIPYWFHDLRKWTGGMTQKFRDTVGKPIDRSGADAKGAELAKSMDEAAKAQADMARKVKKTNTEFARQQREAGSGGRKKDGFDGEFGHL